jgi:hypothetical protein
MKNYLFLLTIILFACTTTRQSADDIVYDANGVVETPKKKGGKCYEKAVIPSQYEMEQERYPVYTGVGTPEGVERMTVQLKPSATKWVQKGSGDAAVWCLVEVPGEETTVWIVKDTAQIKTFEWRSYDKKKLTKQGGVTETVEILCPEFENETFYKELSITLQSRGYLKSTESTNSNTLQSALLKFQQDKGLPPGNLNLVSLRALGIKSISF